MDPPLLRARDLSKLFGRKRALDATSFEVDARIVALLGPNGAGKSTLIKLILGLSRPTGGSLEVFGLDVSIRSLDIRRLAGVLHENPRFSGHHTGRQLLELVSKLRQGFVERDAIEDLSSRFGIARALDRPTRSYSAGMIQRLGIVAAFIGSPRLVILDEPASNLDPAARADLLLFLRTSSERGTRIIMSTHQLAEAEGVCDGVIMLDAGHLVAAGKVADLIPRHDDVWHLAVDRTVDFVRDILSRSIKVEARTLEGSVELRSLDRDGVGLLRTINSVVCAGGYELRELRPAAQASLLDLYRARVRAATMGVER